MEELFTAFLRTWPNVSCIMNSYQFPHDAKPGFLIQRIATASNYPEKQMFTTLLNFFDYQFGALNEKTSSQAVEIAELDSDLTRARSQIRDLQRSVSLGKQQIDNLQETSRENMFLVQDQLKDINELNSKIFSLNSQHSLENERVIRLNDRISLLQEENTLLLSHATKAENGAGEI
ncbi:hypothetical protein HI914_07493 [Erysiphe necator]|nr:hypothetical protein HI914_07493 [Erysiphe necator]